MKRFLILVFLLFITAAVHASENYDIVAVYEKVELKDGTKVCDNFGNMKEVDAIYVPVKLDIGKYEVELTKIGSNFYQIHGTSLYIETKFCMEYAVREEAILHISSSYGFSIGEVFFLD